MLHADIIGTVTLKNGGQIRIPQEALEKMGLCDGDELVVFVGGIKKRLILSKPDTLEENFDQAISQLKSMRKDYLASTDDCFCTQA
jgi:bifunctional DNA-binding transcriptional regulator/antitoxin component of YhaV-PrlF toxin-antitoxin module